MYECTYVCMYIYTYTQASKHARTEHDYTFHVQYYMRDLRCTGTLRSVLRYFRTDVSGLLIGSIFKADEAQVKINYYNTHFVLFF